MREDDFLAVDEACPPAAIFSPIPRLKSGLPAEGATISASAVSQHELPQEEACTCHLYVVIGGRGVDQNKLRCHL